VGRLAAFINRGSTIPTRKEYADYLAYAARYVQDQGISVNFGTEVLGIDDGKDGTIHVRSKNIASGTIVVHRARECSLWFFYSPLSSSIIGDVILAPGGQARIPQCLSCYLGNPLVIHSSAYLTSVRTLLHNLTGKAHPLRIAVVGSGQSAAEVALDLREQLRGVADAKGRHEIHLIIRRGSLKPSDDSPFSNEIFDPSGLSFFA
jgi:L-ornithine N5-oxygenase